MSIRERMNISERSAGEGHDIKHHRAHIPKIDVDPPIAQEIRDAVPSPDADTLKSAIVVEQWRRYDRGVWGEMIHPDGSSNGKTEQVPGLFLRLELKDPQGRPNWLYMDTGEYYRLGNRAYAGT